MTKKARFISFTALLLTMCLMAFPLSAHAATAMDTRTLALINKPGVVLIQSTWSADVSIDQLGVDPAIFDAIDVALAQLNEAGKLTGDMEQLTSVYIQAFSQLLPQFAYASGEIIESRAESAFLGTGFIVTPDGYLLTNAHVVETDEQTMLEGFAYDAAASYVTAVVQAFAQSLYDQLGVMPSQEDLDFLTQTYYSLLIQVMRVSNLSAEYLCFMGNTVGGGDASTKAIQLDLRKKGESIPGKDIAILKMDKTNLPTVALGDDRFIKTGDSVYAMGYPAVATVDGTFNIQQAIQEPTLTSGLISAKKQMAGGWDVLQTSADIHGGNSGGPLFNSTGEVIGINTFGMVEESGASASGMNFAIPISIAKQFLRELNVTPSESQFTADFKRAVQLYNEQDYRGAAEILRKVNEISPGYSVVAELLSECSSLAGSQPAQTSGVETQGSVHPPADGKKQVPWPLVGIGAGGVVLVLFLACVIASRKKAKVKVPSTLETAVPDSSARQAGITCEKCGAKNLPEMKFCNNCGANLEAKKCPQCGAVLAAGVHFCGECGAKL